MNTILIYRLSKEEPVRFAARELSKYLGRISRQKIVIKSCTSYYPGAPGLWLGQFRDFPQTSRKRKAQSAFDDEIYIDVRGGNGVIAGLNPRSVLLAVYRYLTELGFRWVRPGKDGEVLPANNNAIKKRVLVSEKPSHRHRWCKCRSTC